MITLSCPHCQHVLRIPEQYAGQQGRCKKCGEMLTVPKPAPPSSFDYRDIENINIAPYMILPPLPASGNVVSSKTMFGVKREYVIAGASILLTMVACSFIFFDPYNKEYVPSRPPTARETGYRAPIAVSQPVRAPTRNLGLSRESVKDSLATLSLSYQEGGPVDGEPNLVGQTNNGGSLCHVQMVGPTDDLSSISLTVTAEAGNQNGIALSTERLSMFVSSFAPWARTWVKQNLRASISQSSLSTASGNTEVILQGIAATDGVLFSITVEAR